MRENWENRWKDYYKILQVHSSAEQEIIKAAYDRLARKYHPDVNKDPIANERMKDINESFEILGDVEKRWRYHSVWLKKTGISGTGPEPANEEAPVGGPPKGGATASRRRGLPTWGKWVIGLAVLGFILAVVVPNLTSSSQTPTPKIPTPTTRLNSLPNVKIQSVTLPSNVRVSSGDLVYDHTFRIVNNELVDVTINWQGNSSITGNFDSGSITVPKNSYRDVIKSYYYITTGMERITYTIYYNGTQLDTWSGNHYIAQSPTSVTPSLTSTPTSTPTPTFTPAPTSTSTPTSTPTPTFTLTPIPTPSPGTIFTYSGTGQMNTSPFETSSSPWLLRYTVDWDRNFAVTVKGNFVVNQGVLRGQTYETYIYGTIGSLYFSIVSAPANGRWTLSVVENPSK